MNVLNALKTAGSWLLGGGSGEKGFDLVRGVGGWIDEQQFTDQERADYGLERAKRYGEFLENTINENTQRSITRRSLALLVLRWWIAMLTASAVMYKVDASWSAYIFKVATYQEVTFLVIGIGAFFWGSHLLRTRPGAGPKP